MINIFLTRGKIATIDECDAHLANYKWCFNPHGYAVKAWEGNKFYISMHHAIMGRGINGFEIDHIDGNGLNNCRNNLRLVTHRENMANAKCHRAKTKSSKYVGVAWSKASGKWMAQIQIKDTSRKRNRRSIYLGMFATQEEASDAYNKFLHNLPHFKKSEL